MVHCHVETNMCLEPWLINLIDTVVYTLGIPCIGMEQSIKLNELLLANMNRKFGKVAVFVLSCWLTFSIRNVIN